MDRVVDPGFFAAEGALVSWARLYRDHLTAARRSHVEPPREPKRGADLQLRWHVSSAAGVPPVPFTVWIRRDKDRLVPLDVRSFRAGADTGLVWGGTPLVTLRVRCTPTDPNRPCSLWGLRTTSGIESAVAVAAVTAGPGPHTLMVRAGSITHARLVNATVVSARAATVDDVVRGSEWEPFELVGLPYDPDAWASAVYAGTEQGLVAQLTDPFDAAVQRLVRAAPALGWFPVTEAGFPAPRWDEPAPDALVKEVRELLLRRVDGLFAPGVVPARQHELRVVQSAEAPTQDGRVAQVQTSTVTLPPFGALVVPATTDPFTALAAGFGTGYAVEGDGGVGGEVDMMVTATYPDGVDGRGGREYAWVVPWPDQVSHMPPPGQLGAARAGLTDPVVRDAPWRETVSLEWDALPRSALLGRAVGAAAATYDPSVFAEATALLERRDSGGWRPLVPQRRLPPRTDRVAVTDAARELPRDGSARTSGYAVAQQDPFGVWSPWEDVEYSGAEPNPPVPVIGEFSAEPRHTGSTVCPTELTLVITVDWAARTPVFVQVPVVMAPAAYPGAPDPPGLTPFGTPPPPGRRLDLYLKFTGDVPDPMIAGLVVECLGPDGDAAVPPGAATQGGAGRRYRLRYTGLDLDFVTALHWGLAAWAREVAAGRPTWGATSPVPSHASASSPVPVVVPAVPLPIVPLGSLPDAEGRSHVSLRLGGLPGADRIVIWSASEVRVREAAGLGGIPPGRSLSERFVALKQAFAALPPAMQREVFTRVEERRPGPVTGDVALPRGSREITLFAVTAVTATNVESPWPTHVDQLQAAAAPTPVPPSAPELSVAFADTAAGPRAGLTMAAHSRVEVLAFEVHRTYLGEAAASSGTMGPPIASVPAVAVAHPGGVEPPAGTRYEATWVDPAPGDWRDAHYRAVAVPVLGTADRERGWVTRRSADSAVASLLLPPPEAPTLTLAAVDDWGPTLTGVVVRVRTDAPVVAHPLGTFTLAVDARRSDGTPMASFAAALAEVAEGPTGTPPADAGSGRFTRGAPAAGLTTVAAWFARPAITDEVHVRITLADPLGRRRELAVTVPAGTTASPPTVTITGVRRSGTAVAVLFTTDAPAEAGPLGPHRLAVAVRSLFVMGGGATAEMALPDVPDMATLPPNPPGRLVVARRRIGRRMEYGALVRVRVPFVITVTVTDPEGRPGTARRRVTSV